VAHGAAAAGDRTIAADDPVRLEVFGSRFMSIAEQMGTVLRKTAISTNIKEFELIEKVGVLRSHPPD